MISNDTKKENFDILLSAIISISDTSGKAITYNTLNVEYTKSKYSTTYSYILYIDNEPCTGYKRNYKITYRCRCGRIHTILLRKYLEKDKLICRQCNQDHNFGELGHNNVNRPKAIKSLQEPKDFLKEPDEFQKLYFDKHLTLNEFKLWLPVFQQINNTVLTDDLRKTIIYTPAASCNNQQKYTSYVTINNATESFKQVYLKCGVCGKIHSVHIDNLKIKNPENIKCSKCALCNTTFPIRPYKNTNITYQSSIEYKFLTLCESYNIEVRNGWKLPYIWNNKQCRYLFDFYLPEYNLLIELKSNNVYYRMQLDNGKFNAKCKAGNEYASENNAIYVVLFDSDIDEFFKALAERDSQTFREILKKYQIKS